MIQFQTPQFIETEDKLVGPMTLKQFAYVGTAGIISAILLFILNFGFWIIVTAVLGGISTFLAFAKYNGRPISVLIASLYKNIWSPSVYVFQPKTQKRELPNVKPPRKPLPVPEFKMPELKVPKIKLPARKKKVKKAEPEEAPLMEELPPPPEELPEIQPSLTEEVAEEAVETEAPPQPKKTAEFRGIKDLWVKMNTSKNAVPYREKPLPSKTDLFEKDLRDRFSAFRQLTGEREVAKRIDYR